MKIYRCRKCRQNLDVHHSLVKDLDGCTEWNTLHLNVIHLDIEACPKWVVEAVEQAGWIRGKLNCVKCNGRLGLFDFVNQKTCKCRQHTIPAIHLLTSRIDEINVRDGNVPQNNFSNNRTTLHGDRFTLLECGPGNNGSDRAREMQLRNTHAINTDVSNLTEERSGACSSSPHTMDGSPGQLSANCCGQVDSFQTQDSTINQPVATDSDGSEQNVLDFDMYNVLPVEDIEIESVMPKIETLPIEIPDVPAELTCAVCLEMFCSPHRCEPCSHTFCGHCLRQLRKQTPSFTKCPLCRNVIRRCVIQRDLDDHIKSEYKDYSKQRLHETRKSRKETYPLPQCTEAHYQRHLHFGSTNASRYRLAHAPTYIIRSSLQEILVRFAWLLLIFIIHNVLYTLGTWFRFDQYLSNFSDFNYFMLILTCKLVVLGIVYLIKQLFYTNLHHHFMGQAVLFVFMCSFLWDSNSWIRCALNMIILGSLFL